MAALRWFVFASSSTRIPGQNFGMRTKVDTGGVCEVARCIPNVAVVIAQRQRTDGTGAAPPAEIRQSVHGKCAVAAGKCAELAGRMRIDRIRDHASIAIGPDLARMDSSIAGTSRRRTCGRHRRSSTTITISTRSEMDLGRAVERRHGAGRCTFDVALASIANWFMVGMRCGPVCKRVANSQYRFGRKIALMM